MRSVLLGCCLVLTAGSGLAEEYWSYRDWNVQVGAPRGVEDTYVTCRAWTGGDGDPILTLEVYAGDAGPPYHYPMATLREIAPRRYPTQMQDGQTVDFLFDFDREFYIAAPVAGWINDEGLAEAQSRLQQGDTLPMLHAMKKGSYVESWIGNDMIYEASLRGFTAAYGKMMDECGFSLHLPS